MNTTDLEKLENTLTTDEKLRLFNGDGNWRTWSAGQKLPSIFMSDGPHGLRKQDISNYANINNSVTATCFPTASCIASSWNPLAAQKLGAAIATEAKAQNVQLMLGPGMNIKRSPLCGRNFEYFSEDPLLTGTIASAYVKGMQNNGVGSCIKHFACNNQEKRRQTSSSNVDDRTLRKIYLSAFEKVIKTANPAAVMCSYNKLNGTYTSHNKYLLTQILRNEWNYNGCVISDWGACINAAECVKAGLDLAMPDSKGYFTSQLKTALQNGTLSIKDIEKANLRVLNMAATLLNNKGGSLPLAPTGLVATPSSGAEPSENQPRNAPVDFNTQHNIALELAQESAVLLQNKGMLPLKKQKILILGELARNMKFQGGGSSHINCKKYPDAVESLINAGFEVIYEPGYFSGFCKRSKAKKKNAPLIAKALKQVEIAAESGIPVLLFCGLTEAFEGEGFDRSDLSLPQEQIELITKTLNITKNAAVISFSGAPIDLTPAKESSAILHMYLCGQACGEAVANLVCGKTNPSGKLAETWPFKIEDTPCYTNFALEENNINYEEKELVGYRWYNKKNIPVQFKFGFGLSYTTFNSTLKNKDSGAITENKIELKTPEETTRVLIKNTGNFYGGEVIQTYYNNELCGFKKVFLEPGEEKEIVIENEFSNYDQYSSELPACTQETDSAVKFTVSSSLGDMAKSSLRIKIFLKIIRLALVIMNKKPADDPSVKIQICAIEENPVESLISTSGGIISEKLANRFVKWAN